MKKVVVYTLLFCGAVLTSSSLFGANTPIRIMPLGDSLTSGNYTPVAPDAVIWGGYRPRLYELLAAAQYNVDFVGNLTDSPSDPTLPDLDHEGHGGFQIHELDALLEGALAAIEEPDVILLLIGTNDYSVDNDLPHAIDRLETLIDHIATLRPYARIIVSNLPLRLDGKDDLVTGVAPPGDTGINDKIPAIVSRQVLLGRRISWIDLRKPAPECCGPADMSDDLHPTPAGYDKMANTWFAGITAVIGPTDTASRSLTVNSVNPSSGVTVTVSPATGGSSGSTPFTRSFPDGTDVTLTAPSSSVTGNFLKWRRNGVDYSTSAAVSVPMNSSATLTAIYSAGPLAPANVPEAVNYTLVYSLDLPNQANYNTTGVPYELDNSASVGAFNRIGYYLELQQSGGAVQYLWVSMDAFTSDVNKIGVPTMQSGAFFQQTVTAMNVRSSVAGIATANGLAGGNIEFWPGNYTAPNAANVPGASDTVFDWGDSTAPNQAGYGSMQVHNYLNAQTLYSFSGWGRTGSILVDLGIGNSSGANPDWTSAQNAPSYVYKKLQVYVSNATSTPRVLTVNSSNPNSGVTVTVSPVDLNGAGNGSTSFTRSYADGATVTLTASGMWSGNPFQKWQRNGVDFGGGTRGVTVTMSANTTMTAVYESIVVAAHVFYNNSAWDGNNPAANASDDNAIAPDKTPLLPGGKAAFANYTSYHRGLNGIMVDISSLPGTPTAADFAFKVGNNNTPGSWVAGPIPAVTVRQNVGISGSDRVTLIWPDASIAGEWLQLTVLPTVRTGLSTAKVFYFGNATGESGNSPTSASVTGADVLQVYNNLTILAPITAAQDFNRDGRISGGDVLVVYNNLVIGQSALQLIDLTGGLASFATGTSSLAVAAVLSGPGQGTMVATTSARLVQAVAEAGGMRFLIRDGPVNQHLKVWWTPDLTLHEWEQLPPHWTSADADGGYSFRLPAEFVAGHGFFLFDFDPRFQPK